MVRIILVRHGETNWNKTHCLQGAGSDVPLDGVGERQAERLAARLKKEKVAAVYSSPLQRARYTAQAIASKHDLSVEAVAGLEEIGLGRFEGFPSAELPEHFHQFIALNKHLENNPAGEPIEDVQKRAWHVVETIVSAHREGAVVAVSHYFVISSLVCRVLGLPLDNLGRLRMSPATLSAFTIEPEGVPILELFNAPA